MLKPPKVDTEIFSEAFKFNPQAESTKKVGMKEGKNEVLASDSSASDEHEVQWSAGDSGMSEFDYESGVENFLAMGLSKGSVIFVHVNKIDYYQTR